MNASFRIGTKKDETATALALPATTLLRHAVSLGASGSGKTVAMKAICEEAARHGIPVIALDPQGDLASLGLLAPREKVLERGVLPEIYEGFAARREVVVWTPASTDGVPIAVNPLRGRFEGADAETVTKALSGQAEAIASLIEMDSKAAVAFLHIVLEYLNREGIELEDFGALARFIDTMPKKLKEEVEDIATPSLIGQIETQLRVATVGARGLLFRLGAPIDIDLLLGRREGTPGKTRVSVIYLNTLGSQEEKDFFVQMLVSALYQWMLRHPSSELQALLYIDEIAPYLPPVRKPACKEALQLLFKQARKYGIGCLAATQNPGDLDYKALAQVSTWNLGRILVKQDLKKIEKFFQAIAPLTAQKIMKKLPALGPGEFMLLAPDAFEDVVEWKVRWLASEHRTLESSELEKVNGKDLVRRLAGDPEELRKKAAEKRAPASTSPSPSASTSASASAKAIAAEAAAPAPAVAPPPSARAAEELPPGEPTATPGAAGSADEALELVRAAISQAPRVLSRRELCEETGLTPARVDRAIAKLEEDGLVRRYEHGRAHGFSWHAHKLRPELGLTEPVERFKTQVFEGQAREVAEGAIEKAFFVKQERIADSRFFYFPLLKVHFKATKETGWIFKQQKTGTENIYLHPRTCDIVHCGGGVIRFYPTTEDHPLDLVDLDHVGKLESALPGELELRDEDFEKALSREEVRVRAARKFPLEVISVTHAFLPCWGFTLEKKEGAGRRRLVIDAVLGARVEL